MPDADGNGAALLAARYGTEADAGDIPPALAALLDRRVTRRYRPDPVPEPLLETSREAVADSFGEWLNRWRDVPAVRKIVGDIILGRAAV